jgi:hypothetical protein
MSRHNTNANTALQPWAVEAQESLTEYPWDEDDSAHESEDASSVEDITDWCTQQPQCCHESS